MTYYPSIAKIAEECFTEYALDFPVSQKTTYKIGGNADGALFPDTAGKATAVVKRLKEEGVPFVFLGNGSNVLISDEGFRGAVVCSERLKGITVSGKMLTALSGEPLSSVIKTALYSSLGGLEFLSGIPASVGGAVSMNAGCYGKNVGDYVSYVVTTGGVLPQKDCGFDYRESVFSVGDDMILSVCFNLEIVEFEQSEEAIEKFLKLRAKKTPKGRSCGSVFKNDGYFAGKLIEQSGMKGVSVGGATVSEKHANFIIADKTAKSSDVYDLIRKIKDAVKRKTGAELKEELKFIGKFND